MTINALVRALGVTCTLFRSPDSNSSRPSSLTVSNSNAAARWLWSALCALCKCVLQDRGQIRRQRMFKLNDGSTIHGVTTRHIQLLDHAADLRQIARGGMNDQRIGSAVGRDQHFRAKTGSAVKKLLNRLGRFVRGGVSQLNDQQFAFRRNRLVEFTNQIERGLERISPTDDQQGVWLRQGCDRDPPLARTGIVFGNFLDDLADRFARSVLEFVDLDLRLGAGGKFLEAFDDFCEFVDVRVATAEDDDIQVRKHFDLDVVAQVAEPLAKRRVELRILLISGRLAGWSLR